MSNLLNSSDLEQSPEGSSADWAVVRLISEAVCTGVAKAEMPTGEDDGVSEVDHADDALRTAVVEVIVHVRVRLRLWSLVLQPVDLLQQVAQTIDKELLLVSL